MGNSQSQHLTTKFSEYRELKNGNEDWSGQFTLLGIGRKADHHIIKKTIYLRSNEEARSIIKEYNQTENPQFYVRHPLGIQLDTSDRFCSLSKTIHVYHNNLYPNLIQKMADEKILFLKQCQIWFILSQIVHGLEILYDRSHPHLWLSPATIYYNINQNWFIEDMLYWQGPNFQSFLKYKFYSNFLVSNQTKTTLQNNNIVDIRHAIDEDTYCLGYCIFFMMTGCDAKVTRNNKNHYLRQCEMRYSKKLVNLMKSMIQQFSEHRITMQKLKYRLKVDEESIIAQEVEEFQTHSKRKKMSTDHDKEQSNRKYEPTKTPVKELLNNKKIISNSNWENSTVISNKFGHQLRFSEEQTQTQKKRMYYSPVHVAKKKTSQFMVHSPRF